MPITSPSVWNHFEGRAPAVRLIYDRILQAAATFGPAFYCGTVQTNLQISNLPNGWTGLIFTCCSTGRTASASTGST